MRAIAVTSVIIHHLNERWLPGGFVGVDIFFVISGYLITSIIHREISHGQFSFAAFYLRRIKRILPAFYTVVFSTLLAGLLLLSPEEFKFLASSAKAASLFLSNMHFAEALDYFAPGAKQQPLLHTWSLAVEEQFYLVWPILLVLARGSVQRLLILAGLLCLASFGLATVWAYGNETWAKYSFFSLPTRFGELLLGGLLAIRQPQVKQPALVAAAGMVLVAASFVLITPESRFPGVLALLPCLGAVLLMAAGSAGGANPVSRVLSARPVVTIGLLSYSLYLWHWPIITFTRHVTFADTLGGLATLFCVVLTLVLSWLSWRFIETPIRKARMGFGRAALLYFLLPLLLVLGIHQIAKKTEGHLLHKNEPSLEEIRLEGKGCVNELYEDCRIGVMSGEPSVMVFGDSHAVHYSALLDKLAARHQAAAWLLAGNGCPIMPAFVSSEGLRCRQISQAVYDRIHKVDVLVIALRWEWYFGFAPRSPARYNVFEKALERQLAEWAESGKQVYLMAQVAGYQHDVPRALRFGKKNPQSDRYLQANLRLNTLASRHANIHVVDFNPVITGWQNGVLNGKPAYRDDNHLNLYAQIYLAEQVDVPFFR